MNLLKYLKLYKAFRTKIVHIYTYNKFFHTRTFAMANTRFQYVRQFESNDRLLPNQWIVLLLQCQNIDQLSADNSLLEPNDEAFVDIMKKSAITVMEDYREVILSYGFRGEFAFVFRKDTTLYKRRLSKLSSCLCSLFTSSIVTLWPDLKGNPMINIPVFEGSVYLFAEDQCLRDFLTERQYLCHQTNLFKTTLWALMKKNGMKREDALVLLEGTNEADKNEILYSKCATNYNNEKNIYKKGVTFIRSKVSVPSAENTNIHVHNSLTALSVDFVNDSFWTTSNILGSKTKNVGKWNHLKNYHQNNKLLPHTYIIIRIDGKNFHKFSETHEFAKPNDRKAIELMCQAANGVMSHFPDVVLAYGQSDEFSFVIDRYSKMLDRFSDRIITQIVSIFSSTYTTCWNNTMQRKLQYPPTFDSRAVLYPTIESLRDYLSWRQADCHINNMYNTCFWMLVEKGMSRQEAEKELIGTFSDDKQKLLLDKFNIGYYSEDQLFRKGTVIYRRLPASQSLGEYKQIAEICLTNSSEIALESNRTDVVAEQIDIIGDGFWNDHPWLLGKFMSTYSV